MASKLSPSTWRLLGLSVAAGYTGIGLTVLSSPHKTAHFYGVKPAANNLDDPTIRSLALIAVRDISIGAALFAFDYKRMPESMGILILAGTILTAADALAVWRTYGAQKGLLLGAAASTWTLIGWGLLPE